jgi:hypothetical protein
VLKVILRNCETRKKTGTDAKTVSKACKIGLYPPNWTLPVNNTVKKGRIDLENLKLFARLMDSATKPDKSIGYPKGYGGYQKDRKLNGLRGFVVKRNCSGKMLKV